MNYKTIQIGNKKIGQGEQVFIIAEIGINHNQDMKLAKKLVDVAVSAGCDAAKFQTFKAKSLYVGPKAAGNYKLMGKSLPIYDLLRSLEMPKEWVVELSDYCKSKNILFFSTPVDAISANMLEPYADIFKIASYDCTNLPFIKFLAQKDKALIMSTGAANLGEVEEAINTVHSVGNKKMAIMHCVAEYPAPFEDANLAVINTMKRAFQIPVGLSDHSIFRDIKDSSTVDPYTIPVAATALGVDIIEKHITLDRNMPGPDQKFATEPDELKEMVRRIRLTRKQYLEGKRLGDIKINGQRIHIPASILGTSVKRTLKSEEYIRNFAYRCIFATKDIKKNSKLSKSNIGVLRPGSSPRGLEPKFYDLLIGKARASKNIKQWQPIIWDDVL